MRRAGRRRRGNGGRTMKVNIKPAERVLLALYALLGLLAALFFGAAAVSPEGLAFQAFGREFAVGQNIFSSILAALAALVLLAWSVRLIMLAFKRPPKKDRTSVSVQNTENGDVRVSIAAMDTLVRQAIGEEAGVSELHSAVENHEDSITVDINMTLESDVHIPNVTMMLQRRIKSFIEEYAGIAVRDVRVMIDKIVEVTPPPAVSLPPQKDPAKLAEPEKPEETADAGTEPEESAEEPEEPAEETEEPAEEPEEEEPEEPAEEAAESAGDEDEFAWAAQDPEPEEAQTAAEEEENGEDTEPDELPPEDAPEAGSDGMPWEDAEETALSEDPKQDGFFEADAEETNEPGEPEEQHDDAFGGDFEADDWEIPEIRKP